MRDEFRPAIEALQTDLSDLENKVAETKRAINRLCELAGAPPMFTEVNAPSQKAVGALRSDQFYGKVMTTAAREYLELRKASNRGPASPREIYEALVEGGFKFDTKSEVNAMTGLRQILRKNSSIFHKLPNGQYGLMAWYPNAKPAKQDVDEDDSDATGPSKTSSKRPQKRAKKPKKEKVSNGDENANGSTVAREFLLQHLNAEISLALNELVRRAEAAGLHFEGRSLPKALHGTLLGMKSQKLAEYRDGGWRKASAVAA